MGIEHDLVTMTAWIPEDKKRKTIDMLDTLLAEPPPEFVDLKLAERLHGLLNWVSQLLVTGQYHLPQIIGAFRRAKSTGSKARVTRALRAEMAWWKEVLTDWNCIAIILPPLYAAPAFSYEGSPTTDACRSPSFAGAGAWFRGYYDYFEFTALERAPFTIMALEALIFVLWIEALLLKDSSLISGRVWRARCDNEAWVAIVTSGKCNK